MSSGINGGLIECACVYEKRGKLSECTWVHVVHSLFKKDGYRGG